MFIDCTDQLQCVGCKLQVIKLLNSGGFPRENPVLIDYTNYIHTAIFRFIGIPLSSIMHSLILKNQRKCSFIFNN